MMRMVIQFVLLVIFCNCNLIIAKSLIGLQGDSYSSTNPSLVQFDISNGNILTNFTNQITWPGGASSYDRRMQIYAVTDYRQSITYTFISEMAKPIQKVINFNINPNAEISSHMFLSSHKSIVFFINSTSQNQIGVFYTVDMETFKVEKMFNIQAPLHEQFIPEAKIAIDEKNGLIYVTMFSIALGIFDLNTGAYIHTFAFRFECDYLEYHDRYLYCVDLYPETVYQINPKTGDAVSLVSEFCSNPAWLMDIFTFDFDEMKAYLVGYCDAEPSLVTLDLAKGTFSSISHEGLNYYSKIHVF